MENLPSLEMSVLVDLLSVNTQKYTQFLTEGGDAREFEKIKLAIAALQTEISRRKAEFDNNSTTSLSGTPDFVE